MGLRQWRQFRWKIWALIFITGPALFFFQNCSGVASSSLGNTGVNALLASEPVPVLFNLNEISYMSCPMAGASTAGTGDPLGNPFYRIRVGAYDNSAANGFTNPTGGAQVADQVGGLGFSAAAMAYMRKSSTSPSVTMLQNYLTTSPYTSATQPVVALVNQYRTTSSLAWTSLGAQILVPFSDPTLSYLLASAPQVSGAANTSMGYFPTLTSGATSILTSLNWGSSIADESNFRTNLMNEYVIAGFAPTGNADATSMTQNLQGPNGVVTGPLFGYGYSFNFNFNDPSLNGVYEYDMSTAAVNPNNLTTQNGQGWDCFALTVVRDIDRKYWTTTTAFTGKSTFLSGVIGTSTNVSFAQGAVVHPYDVPTLGTANLQSSYLRDGDLTVVPTTNDIPYVMLNLENTYTSAAGGQLGVGAGPTYNNNIWPINTIDLYMGQNGYDGGTYYACPPEDPSAMTTVQLERLRIVRRFLPANLWDVNITRNCAVPTTTAEASGSCYNSGDTVQTKYIQYNGVPGTTCGAGLTECPAKVSFCWRYH